MILNKIKTIFNLRHVIFYYLVHNLHKILVCGSPQMKTSSPVFLKSPLQVLPQTPLMCLCELLNLRPCQIRGLPKAWDVCLPWQERLENNHTVPAKGGLPKHRNILFLAANPTPLSTCNDNQQTDMQLLYHKVVEL